MGTITRVQPSLIPAPAKKRVAAYARVSFDSENLLRSLSNQVSHYSRLIQQHPDWQFVRVYTDSGVTGTSTANRTEFKRLMADCYKGKIDLVLTKSISRFARNTVDLLSAIRELRDIGVEVYFEEQHISTMGNDGELLPTLLAAVAQAESENISKNILWTIHKRFEQGLPNGYKRMLGYKWDGEKYVIIPNEAETVRRIYALYLEGKTTFQIAKELGAVRSVNGNPISPAGVAFILDNVNYTGDLWLQKRYSPSVGKRAVNRGEMAMYKVEDAHEGIIDTETYAAVQNARAERRQERKVEVSPFSGKLVCGYCGHAVCRRRHKEVIWRCNAADKKSTCKCRQLPEAELLAAVSDAASVARITVFDDRLEIKPYKGAVRVWRRAFTSGSKRRSCFTRKLYNGDTGVMLCRKNDVWRCVSGGGHIKETELREALSELGMTEMRFYCEVERVLIYEDRLELMLGDGGVRVWRRK